VGVCVLTKFGRANSVIYAHWPVGGEMSVDMASGKILPEKPTLGPEGGTKQRISRPASATSSFSALRMMGDMMVGPVGFHPTISWGKSFPLRQSPPAREPVFRSSSARPSRPVFYCTLCEDACLNLLHRGPDFTNRMQAISTATATKGPSRAIEYVLNGTIKLVPTGNQDQPNKERRYF